MPLAFDALAIKPLLFLDAQAPSNEQLYQVGETWLLNVTHLVSKLSEVLKRLAILLVELDAHPKMEATKLYTP